MLKIMRKHAKYFYFLFFMVIISFIGWGVGTVDKTGGVEIVAEVGKYKIMADEYRRAYDIKFEEYRDHYKEKFDEEMQKKLKEYILNSLINRRVLLIAAKEEGITVSDEELNEAIIHEPEPAFMKNGVFDNNLYQRLDKVTRSAYENSKRQELTLRKMVRFIELSVNDSDIDAQLPKIEGNEQAAMMIRQALLNAERDKAVLSYIEGLKKQIKIKVNKQLIA